jgi:hypothetical protein
VKPKGVIECMIDEVEEEEPIRVAEGRTNEGEKIPMLVE